jgi:hypothetical protein
LELPTKVEEAALARASNLGDVYAEVARTGDASTAAQLSAPYYFLSAIICCLAFAVMVFGKFLEPLDEDWVPKDSEFLSKDQMQ